MCFLSVSGGKEIIYLMSFGEFLEQILAGNQSQHGDL